MDARVKPAHDDQCGIMPLACPRCGAARRSCGAVRRWSGTVARTFSLKVPGLQRTPSPCAAPGTRV